MAAAFVIWSCVAIVSLVLLIAVDLIVVRVIGKARRRRQQELERQWLPVLISGLEQGSKPLPAIEPRDMAWFFTLWIRLHDSIKGFNEPLHRMALLAGMDKAARRMFSSRHVRDKLLAIATLGRLRDRSMWDDLVPLTSHRDLMLSLSAAQAIVRIDAPEAMTLLLPIIARREDWPPATVAAMLEEAGTSVISTKLADAIFRAPASQAHRLIRFLGLAHSDVAVPLLRVLLREVKHVESITACLRAFTDSSDMGAVRPYLQHPRWEVRLRAVDTFGRLATGRDEERLIAMLSDKEWWVRYRTAQALCRLLSRDLDRVHQLRTTLSDPFARDMLTHVLAEQGAA